MCREAIQERVSTSEEDIEVDQSHSEASDIDVPDQSQVLKADHVILSVTDNPTSSSHTNNVVATVS